MICAIREYVFGRYTEPEFPALARQIEEWSAERPFAGMKVLDATPVFSNTLVKYLALLSGGAELMVGIGDLTPFDHEVLEFLRRVGVPIVHPAGAGRFDVVMDCSGCFADVPSRYGYVELTRSGVYRYRGHRAPVFFADAGRIKLIETSLGTGEGYLRAMKKLGFSFAGKRVLVFGGGKVGRGIAAYALRAGASVVISDLSDKPAAMPRGAELIGGADREVVKREICSADYIVSATGRGGALGGFASELSGSRAVIANMGVEDEFGPELPASRTLNNKRPLNFMLPEPTLLKYIDPTLALDNLGALELRRGKVPRGVQAPSAELEEDILEAVRRGGLIADELELIEE